ncbi:LysR family transcriptional regulator [Inquilinus sp.]|uniref:LysR family transcriptional regulator n=1 Tax=Inquilinus sp. TaxID=1932117 RepID=UPI0031D964A1
MNGMRRYDWNDLSYFVEVARHGTLSGAARAIGSDHATVSRRIAALEHALGSPLFHRSPVGYMLTPAGAALLPHAERVETAARAATEALGRPQAGLAGKIRLATPDGFGNHFLARHLGKFTAAYPRLTIELVTVSQIQSLSQREGELSVTLAPPARGRFQTERLTEYDLAIYGDAGYLTEAPPVRTRQDLRAHRFIGYVDDLVFTRELDYLGEVLPGLSVPLQATSLLGQLNAVLRGDGLCVLPRFIAGQHPALVEVLPGEVRLRRSYWISAHQDQAELPRVRVLREFIRHCVERHGDFLMEG